MRNTHMIMLLATPMLLAAQQGNRHSAIRGTKSAFTAVSAQHEVPDNDRSDDAPLWTEDFETGLNGWNVDVPYGNVSWVLTSEGNTAGFTSGPLESTTGYPGGQWIVADSDAQGTAGLPENTTITSPAILGFDTVRYMLLRFQQAFRQLNNDQTVVEVSGNGGADWTVYPVNQNVAGNQSTPGAPEAEVVTVNISSALAEHSADIRIRFRWTSDQGFTYSWQVDDIALLPVKPNDITLLEADHAAWDLETMGYDGMPCTIYPLGETHELRFKGLIGNNGSTAQNDVHLRVDVSGPGGYEMTLTSGSITMEPGVIDSLFITGYELPDITGDHVFTIRAEQDGTDDYPDDNTIQRRVQVDPSIFARDNGRVESARDNNGFDYELGNRFWIEEYGRAVEAIEVALGPGTEAGAVVSAKLYNGTFGYLAQSDLHVVSASEINAPGGNSFISLPLLDAPELVGERLYLVCVYVQTSDGEAFTGTSGTSEPQTSMLYRYDNNQWYYTTSTPMVRMRLDEYVGIADGALPVPVLTASPSPFDEGTTVRSSSVRGGETRWELRDATGRLWRTGDVGSLPPGEQRFFLSGEGLSDGVYVLSVETGGERSMVKLVRQARR